MEFLLVTLAPDDINCSLKGSLSQCNHNSDLYSILIEQHNQDPYNFLKKFVEESPSGC